MSPPPREARSTVGAVSRRAALGALGTTGLVALSGCTVRQIQDWRVNSRSPPPPSGAPEGEWPQPRRDARNAGRTRGPGPGSKAGVVWTYEWPVGTARPRHEPAVAGRTVYAPEYGTATLTALDVADGSRRWTVGRDGDDRGTTAPAVADGLVLAGRHGALHAYDHTGTRRWTPGDRLRGEVRGVTVAGDAAYVATAGGAPGLHAVALADGRVRWRRETGPLEAPPAVAGGLVFAAGTDGRLLAADRESGTERWEAPVGAGWTKSAPLVDHTTVYVGASDPGLDAGAVTAVDAVTGRREWRRKLDGTGVASSLALGRGTLYAATADGDLLALDTETGAERWSFSPDGAVPDGGVYADNSPVVAGDHVYYAGAGDRLYAVPRDGGGGLAAVSRADWSADVGDLYAPPVVVGEYLFAGSRTGVSCLGPAGG